MTTLTSIKGKEVEISAAFWGTLADVARRGGWQPAALRREDRLPEGKAPERLSRHAALPLAQGIEDWLYAVPPPPLAESDRARLFAVASFLRGDRETLDEPEAPLVEKAAPVVKTAAPPAAPVTETTPAGAEGKG